MLKDMAFKKKLKCNFFNNENLHIFLKNTVFFHLQMYALPMADFDIFPEIYTKEVILKFTSFWIEFTTCFRMKPVPKKSQN